MLQPCATAQRYSPALQPCATARHYSPTLQPDITARHYSPVLQPGATAQRWQFLWVVGPVLRARTCWLHSQWSNGCSLALSIYYFLPDRCKSFSDVCQLNSDYVESMHTAHLIVYNKYLPVEVAIAEADGLLYGDFLMAM